MITTHFPKGWNYLKCMDYLTDKYSISFTEARKILRYNRELDLYSADITGFYSK
jgi:hypothetical protein